MPKAASLRSVTIRGTNRCPTSNLAEMDPVTELVGVQKRLRNLGFDCEPSGVMDDATAAARSRRFQT